MITPETKFNCQVNICIWCKSQASVDALRVMFSGTSDFKLRYVRIHQGNDNTVITFPIFHDISMPEQGLFSCAVEGSIPNFPGLRDVVAFAYEFTSLCKDLVGMEIEYMEAGSKSFGVFKATRDSILQRWVRPMDWPDIDCQKNCPCDGDDEIDCNNCHDVLSEILEKNGTETTYTDTVCYGFVPEEEEDSEMDMDNLDRPKLDVNKEQMKQIYDAIKDISCINDDIISKLGKAPEMLKQVVKLANCLMAIWHGEADHELSDIEEIADSIDVINRATCDLVDSMRNIGAELIQD